MYMAGSEIKKNPFLSVNKQILKCKQANSLANSITHDIKIYNILLHPQLIVCATVKGQCLEYLGYITLPDF